jgi:hypothetical protein
MPNHPQGNGRNVALPDENRPSWRPQDEHSRNRRYLGEEDDRYEDERYLRGYWEDRDRRDWDRDREERYGQGRYQGYPGAFEDRYRDRPRHFDDRFAGRGYYDRDWEAEDTGVPRGYAYSDGDRERDRSRFGTGGGISGSYPLHRPRRGVAPGAGYRGKGPAGYQRTDERLRELICEALTDDDRVDATNIEVTVKNGEVTLSGTVEERQMKRSAEDCVEAIYGVRDIQNLIRVFSTR